MIKNIINAVDRGLGNNFNKKNPRTDQFKMYPCHAQIKMSYNKFCVVTLASVETGIDKDRKVQAGKIMDRQGQTGTSRDKQG